ncbi:MmcQ/YjbR family DNA-binding protein [Bizionia paragorgiae]|uniref:MmcQ/YjbR family DNA-binding protein n=1 Tax=Bizionia paragorgiae TaxID=283786 RepID=UPI003A92AF74
MISLPKLRKLALSFPGTTEEPHFEKISFRVNKKIFVTYDSKNNRACFKLSLSDQDLFSLYDETIVYAVPNKWGNYGWTFVELRTVRKNVLKSIIKAAYKQVAI